MGLDLKRGISQQGLVVWEEECTVIFHQCYNLDVMVCVHVWVDVMVCVHVWVDVMVCVHVCVNVMVCMHVVVNGIIKVQATFNTIQIYVVLFPNE